MIVQPEPTKARAALLACAVLLGGCQGMSDSSMTQLQGTGAGAGLGALIGGLAGGNSGALIGAAIGGAAGLGLGSAVAYHKREYADAESVYDAQIRRTGEKNVELAQYNEALGQQIAEYHREIASLQAQMRAGKADYQAARRTEQRLQASYAECSRMLEDGRRVLAEQEQLRDAFRRSDSNESARLRRENAQIAALSNHVSVLQQQSETMASQGNQLQQFR